MPDSTIEPTPPWGGFAPVVFAPLLILVALAAWMLASPIGAAPDDNFHLPSSWCGIGERPGLCEPGDSALERKVPKGVAEAPLCYHGKPMVAANCQNGIMWSTDMVSTAAVNKRGLYPTLFYAVMAPFASQHVITSALLMRLANILLFVLLATGVYCALPPSRRPVLALGGLITTVPLGCFLIASNNPSSWSITSALIVWVATAGSLESVGTRRWALAGFAVVGAVMGAGARADAAVIDVVAAASAVAITMRRDARYLRGLILPGIVAVAAIALFLTSDQLGAASSGGLATSADRHAATGVALLISNLTQIPSLWVGVFGTWELGWFDTALPTLVWVTSLAAFVFTVTLFLRRAPKRKIIVLVGILVLLIAIPLFLLQAAQSSVGDSVQPRYLLPLIIIGAGIALWHDRVHHGLTRAQAWWIISSVTLANAVALHVNMRRYITGASPRLSSLNLDQNAQWWWPMPIGPTLVWAVGSVAFGLGAYLIVWHSLQPGKRPQLTETGPLNIEPRRSASSAADDARKTRSVRLALLRSR